MRYFEIGTWNNSGALSCSSFDIDDGAVQALRAHSIHCWIGSRQDIGHTPSSDPARGAFHARGTGKLVGMDIQLTGFGLVLWSISLPCCAG
jgi:hypothetical protein